MTAVRGTFIIKNGHFYKLRISNRFMKWLSPNLIKVLWANLANLLNRFELKFRWINYVKHCIEDKGINKLINQLSERLCRIERGGGRVSLWDVYWLRHDNGERFLKVKGVKALVGRVWARRQKPLHCSKYGRNQVC